MKRLFLFTYIVAALILTSVVARAQTTATFRVSATVPTATSVGITAVRITGTTSTPVTGNNLSFDPLRYDAANGIWLPPHYYAISVAPQGGAGTTDVVVTYTEGANPNAPGRGLGWKAVATFVRVAGTTETPLTAHGPKRMLKDLTRERITALELRNSYLKIYLGLVTGDPAQTIPDPAGAEPITNADRPGVYDGTLTITATVV